MSSVRKSIEKVFEESFEKNKKTICADECVSACKDKIDALMIEKALQKAKAECIDYTDAPKGCTSVAEEYRIKEQKRLVREKEQRKLLGR